MENYVIFKLVDDYRERKRTPLTLLHMTNIYTKNNP